MEQDGKGLLWIRLRLWQIEEVEFYVEEQTRVNGVNYILVSDSMEEEANAYILKDLSADTDLEADYVMVEDEVELEAISKVFSQMMEDVDIEM